METRGFGHQPVVDGLVPQLIGLERRRERLVGPAKIAASPPIIEIVGGRLAGKTLLLEELYEGYRNRIPLAYLDLTDPRLVSRAVPHGRYAATASPTVRVLYTLAYLLGRYVPGFGELQFQRLLLGLLVVSVWHPDHSDEQVLPEDLQGAEADLRRFLRRVHDRDPERRRREALSQWVRALSPVLKTVLPSLFGVGPGAQHAVRAVVAMVTSQLRASRLHDRAVSWWGQRLRTDLGFQGDDLECLFDLARHFPPRGRALTGGETLLVRALLADVSDYYGPLRRFNRRHPPLILLDNLHSPVGAHLRKPLARAYSATGVRVRPVIVTTTRGLPTSRQRGAFVAAAQSLPSQRDPNRVFLRLGIPAIEAHIIEEQMLGDHAYSPRLPRLVVELSGGRAGWASWLAREVVGQPPPDGAPADDEWAVGNPDPDGAPGSAAPSTATRRPPLLAAPATGRLLDQLYPDDPQLQADLTLLAPALDTRCARSLWLRHGPKVSPQESAARVARLLDELDADHWQRERWRWPAGEPVGAPHSPGLAVPFIGDRALRTLLLAHLAHTRPVEHWREIHELLRDNYVPPNLPVSGGWHTTAYLHYTLALADVEIVVDSLHARLRDTRPTAWLAAVNVICAAPTPPDGVGPSEPHPPSDPAGQDDLRAAVHDLVTCLWRVSDPRTVTGPSEQERVKSALRVLYKRLYADAFNDAASRWSEMLAAGVRAPDLPVPTDATRPYST